MAGASKSVLSIGNFLSRGGVYRSVIEDLSDQLEKAGWQVIRTSYRRPRMARLADMLATAWLRRNEYGAAHINVFSGPAFIWAEVAAAVLQQAGKPFVLSLHGGNLPSFSRRWPGRVKRLLVSADRVVAPSQFMLHEFLRFRSDMVMISNALDCSRFAFKVRKTTGRNMIWVRAFHRMYNPSLAVKTLSLVQQQIHDTRLMMVGPDTGDGSLAETRQTAAAAGVERNLEIVGGIQTKEIPNWLERGDIFLNTTDMDNTPLSVLEAMACGLCVVSTNVGGIPHLLHNGQDALLVPPNDPESMSQAVGRILSDPGLAGRLSQNARATAEQFDWARILPKWEELLLSVQGAH